MEKERLARRHDDSLEACALRFRAARTLTGLTQLQCAEAAGISPTAWNNAEAARNYPTLTAMRWLYRAHRIDFNFLMAGDFAQLPADIQSSLFDVIAVIHAKSSTDRKSNSDQRPSAKGSLQS